MASNPQYNSMRQEQFSSPVHRWRTEAQRKLLTFPRSCRPVKQQTDMNFTLGVRKITHCDIHRSLRHAPVCPTIGLIFLNGEASSRRQLKWCDIRKYYREGRSKCRLNPHKPHKSVSPRRTYKVRNAQSGPASLYFRIEPFDQSFPSRDSFASQGTFANVMGAFSIVTNSAITNQDAPGVLIGRGQRRCWTFYKT